MQLVQGVSLSSRKTVVANLEDAKIISLAQEVRVPIGVGYCVRHLASTKAVKEFLMNGEIGIVRSQLVKLGSTSPIGDLKGF